MATTMKLIVKQTLTSNVANFSFSNIPQTYTDLLFVASARSTRADIASDLTVAFNSSTSNFTGRALFGSGSTAGSTTGVARFFGVVCGANSTADTFGNAEVYIPNYAGSTNKSFSVSGVQENNASTAYISLCAGLWSDTSAISSMTITDQSGANLVSGSTFYLYGITKA